MSITKFKEIYKTDKSFTNFTNQNSDRYVYLLKDYSNYEIYKIGISYDVENRIKGIFAQSNKKLLLFRKYKIKGMKWFSAYSIEKILHSEFKEKKIHNEWFKLNNSDIGIIDEFLINIHIYY
jgi:hypothetical protein